LGLFKKLVLFTAVIAAVIQIKSAGAVVVASKQYVDSIVPALQPDWDQANINAKNHIKNRPDLTPFAMSGSYDDLDDKPEAFSLFSILSNSITDAVTNDEFYLDIDGFRFRAFKASSANEWGARIVNNTSIPIEYGSRGFHQYSGTTMTNNGGILAIGADLNPNGSANNIGRSKEDVFITHFYDTTNMRLYRWTIHVYVDKAFMILEKLY
jgi:hypothetical protein